MITACGQPVKFDTPHLTKVLPDDLRIHSSNICRYNGAVEWKLVKHLLLVTKLVEHYLPSSRNVSINYNGMWTDNRLPIALAAAHDLHECYVVDIPTGLKGYLASYRQIEKIWEQYVHESIGLPYMQRIKSDPDSNIVKRADRRALSIEMFMLQHPGWELILDEDTGPIYKYEERMFNRITGYSTHHCWDLVWDYVQDGVEAMESDSINIIIEGENG